jgi:hypothetical protein
MTLPENERRLLAAVAAHLEGHDRVDLPLEVAGLTEQQVIKAAMRLDQCDPPVWDGLTTAEASHPLLVTMLTERGLREAGVWPAEPTAASFGGASTDGPFMAQVVRVFIASPGDVPEERNLIEDVVQRWNADHAEALRTVLLPVRWETHASPEVGGHPQQIVNRQIVDGCDLLLGVFWTRLGTPTPDAVSGTAEEISRFLDATKPVSLFFSTRPVQPESIDLEQYKRLQQFKKDLQSRALLADYLDLIELERLVARSLHRIVRERFSPPADQAAAAAAPVAAHASLRARVERGSTSRGHPSWHFVLDNTGAGTAHAVTTELLSLPLDQARRPWHAIDADKPLDYLAPGGSARYLLSISMGNGARCNCIIRWRNEDGVPGMQQQTLTL